MLTFRHDTHEYAWNGIPTLAVTKILELAGVIDTTWYTEFGRDRGKAVHTAIHLYIGGRLDEKTIDPLILPYVNAFIDFLNDSSFRIYQSERPVYSETFDYAGTFDLYGRMKGSRWLIDFKTGSIEEWTSQQTAAYFRAATESGLKPTQRAVLRLKPDGRYLLKPHTDAGDLAEFLKALKTAQFISTVNKARSEEDGNGNQNTRGEAEGV